GEGVHLPDAWWAQPTLLAVPQELDQVGQLLQRKLLIEARGHDRDLAGEHLFHIAARQADFLVGGQRQDDLVGRVLLDVAAVNLSLAGADQHRLIAADEAGAGKQNRLDEVSRLTNLTDSREIGADLAADVADRVAIAATN